MGETSEAVGRGAEPAIDRRRAARERSRLAVVDALLDLYAEGVLRPGADELAARSGVSRRSVFRYFDDLDDLDRTAIQRQQQRVWHLVEIANVGQGPLAQRIDAIAAQRVALFTAVRPAARVARVRALSHHVIAEELEENRGGLTLQVELQFARELTAMTEPARRETLAAASALCSFEVNDLLVQGGMDDAAVYAVIARGLSALFGGAKE